MSASYCVRLSRPSKRRWPNGRKWRQNAATQRSDSRRKQRAGSGRAHATAIFRLPVAALDLVKLQGMVDSLPKILIANRNTVTETLPLPIVFAPLSELATNTATDVSAPGEQCHA